MSESMNHTIPAAGAAGFAPVSKLEIIILYPIRTDSCKPGFLWGFPIKWSVAGGFWYLLWPRRPGAGI